MCGKRTDTRRARVAASFPSGLTRTLTATAGGLEAGAVGGLTGGSRPPRRLVTVDEGYAAITQVSAGGGAVSAKD